MTKNMLRNLFLVCLLALPAGVFAQGQLPPSNTNPINRYDLLDKTWYFIAMKCPDKIGAEAHYIHFYSTLSMTPSNYNNINYGTYVKVNRDLSESPRETGTYSLNTDEVGNLMLTLRKNKSGSTAKYMVPMVEPNHLTLIRTDEVEKCNVDYAVAP
jgi:hypothetical protein